MKLTKKEYLILYYIEKGRTDFERLDKVFNDKKFIRGIVDKLELLGLIKLSYKDGRIYGFMETAKGREEIKGSKYDEWFKRLGD